MKPTQEQVLQWALEVDIDPHDMCEDPRIAENNLERLVTLAYEAGRKDENEAIADAVSKCDARATPKGIAAAIRARREQ